MTVTIPENAAGQTYVVLSEFHFVYLATLTYATLAASSMTVTDDTILAGPAILEVPVAPKAYA